MYLLNEKLMHVLEEEEREKIEMVMTIDSLERRLKICENAHAPPSHGSVPAQQKKARSAERSKSSERAEGKTGGSPGRKPGEFMEFCNDRRTCFLLDIKDCQTTSMAEIASQAKDTQLMCGLFHACFSQGSERGGIMRMLSRHILEYRAGRRA